MVALFVLSIFILVLVVDLVVLKYQGKTHPAFDSGSSPIFILQEENTQIPEGILLSKGHVWLKKLEGSMLQLGIDSFGAQALGNLSLVKSAPINSEIKRGDVLFEASYGSNAIKFLSPIDGMIRSINGEVFNKQLQNPYEAWGVQILSKNFKKQKDFMFDHTKAKTWLKDEFTRLKNFMELDAAYSSLVGETMYDGGLPVDGIESTLDESTLINFEKEFLTL